jgi:DNA-binding transcriptional LysR family regulator
MNTNKLLAVLPDMAVYVLVVETGSFTAAAEQLGVTPSAVSRQISRLEAALEVRLLERTTRKQTTTDEGKAAYDRCKAMVECALDVTSIGDAAIAPSGRICISAPKAYSVTVLQPLVLSFLESHPSIDIHFRVTDTFLIPLRDDVDLAFRLSDHLIEGLVSKPLHTIDSVLCASRSYLGQHGVPAHPSELADHQCIALGEFEQDNRWVFQRGGETAQVDVCGHYTTNHSGMRMSAVKAGLGIGIFPDFVAEQALSGTKSDKEKLVTVLPEWALHSKYQGMVSMQYLQNKFMPSRLRTLINYFIAHLSSDQIRKSESL